MDDVRVIPRDRPDLLGEGLFWSERERALLWTDIIGQRINRLSPSNGTVESWEVDGPPGWIIGQADGDFVAGIGRTIARVSLEPYSCETLASIPGEPLENRVNDAAADAHGRLWFGTMPASCDTPTGRFWLFDKGVIRRASEMPYTIPNGPVPDPEGRFLLHTDSALGVIFRYEFKDGSIGKREPFIRFEDGWGTPDGMTFDAEGYLWVACWGDSCVRRFSPEGGPVRRIVLPASQISNCMFGGEKLDRLFITSAAQGVNEEYGGALFEVDPQCLGLAPHLYRAS